MYILSFSVYIYMYIYILYVWYICMVYVYYMYGIYIYGIYIYIPKFLKIRSDILVRYVMKSYEVAKNH